MLPYAQSADVEGRSGEERGTEDREDLEYLPHGLCVRSVARWPARDRHCRSDPSAFDYRGRAGRGPYALSPTGPSPRREWIGGFDLLECGDIAEAVEIASRHPMACIGSILT
jgi:hypothetical protein